MSITKQLGTTTLDIIWDSSGNLQGASLIYAATFSDSSTGTTSTVTRQVPLDITIQAVVNAANTLYTKIPPNPL